MGDGTNYLLIALVARCLLDLEADRRMARRFDDAGR